MIKWKIFIIIGMNNKWINIINIIINNNVIIIMIKKYINYCMSLYNNINIYKKIIKFGYNIMNC